MSAMYKAIQVTKPGEFATVMKLLVDPGPGRTKRVICGSNTGWRAFCCNGAGAKLRRKSSRAFWSERRHSRASSHNSTT
jgi:hypothetical protein